MRIEEQALMGQPIRLLFKFGIGIGPCVLRHGQIHENRQCAHKRQRNHLSDIHSDHSRARFSDNSVSMAFMQER